MGHRGVGAVPRSQGEGSGGRRPQGAPASAEAGDARADQGGQDVRRPAHRATGAPISESGDGAPGEACAGAEREGRLSVTRVPAPRWKRVRERSGTDAWRFFLLSLRARLPARADAMPAATP